MHTARSFLKSAAQLLVLGAGFTAACTLTPSAPTQAPPPAKLTLDPPSIQQGGVDQFTITGANFSNGVVSVGGSGVSLTPGQVIPNLLTAQLTAAFDAPLGTRTVTLTGSGGLLASGSLDVLPPTVLLALVTPSELAQGASALLTLRGTGFNPTGSSVVIDDGSPGTGLTAGSVNVAADGKSLTAQLSIARTTGLGLHSVRVNTPAGQSNGQAILIVRPRPVITTVSPAFGVAGTSVTVTLTGTGFVSGGSILSVAGNGVSVQDPFSAVLSETSMRATFVIAADAALGSHGVSVFVDGGGGSSNSVPFTVNPPPPTIERFSAKPFIITRGATSGLFWSGVTNATTCTINNGVGPVLCNGGVAIVSPSSTTEYQLLATGPGGREWQYVTVIVEEPRPPSNFSASRVMPWLPQGVRR